MEPPSVFTVSVEQATIEETTTQPATVYPFYSAHIYAKLSGYLAELKVEIGDRVKAGDLLARIDVPELRQQIEKQKRVIQRLQAEQQRAAALVRLEEAGVTAARATQEQYRSQIQQAEAQLTADKAELDRTQDLVNRQSVAPRLLDEVRGRYESALASKAAAEAALQSAAAGVSVSEAKVAAAEAEAAITRAETSVAQAELEEHQVLLAYASLLAPFDGLVVSRNVDPGDLVRNAQTASGTIGSPLFTVVQLDTVRVRVALPENDAAHANVGDEAVVRLRSLGNRSLTGQISRTSGQMELSTRTMLIEIDLPNPDGLLKPGMYGEATIALETVADALVLPASAVRFREQGQAYVYRVDNSGQVQIVEVTTGFDDGRRIVITEGLSAGDRVVDEMIGRLSAGQRVNVVP